MKSNLKKQFLTQKEVADRWRCAESTIINYREKGLISYFQLPGSSKILYLIDDIEEVESQNTKKRGGDKPKAKVKREKPCISSTSKQWRI